MGLECPICLEFYNLNNRQPKVLQCSHSLCDLCVSKLSRGKTIDCPTCRHLTQMNEVKVNFGLRDEVAEKCEACVQHKRSEKCHHCHQELCDACLKEHVGLYHDQLRAKIDKLQGDVVTATGKTMEQAEMEREITAQKQTLKQIDEAYEHQVQRLKEEVSRLKTGVVRRSGTSIGKYQKWGENLDAQLSQCKNLIRKVHANLASTHVTSLTTGQMAKMEEDLDRITRELAAALVGQPTSSTHVFAANSDQYSLGEFLKEESFNETNNMISLNLKVSHSGKPPVSPRGVERYRQVNHVATLGADSGPERLGSIVCLACMRDRFFIMDAKNHRLKIYDANLRLLCIVGDEGTDRLRFKQPWGICCINNEVFVSDMGNRRIKVYNKYGQVLRIFRPESPDEVAVRLCDHEMFNLLGMTGGPEGCLYVCGGGTSTVKVFQPDGTYVRSIGDSSIYTGIPHSVVVSSVGTTFVLDSGHVSVHMFGNSGHYLGVLADFLDSPIRLEELAIDREDNVIVVDSKPRRLVVFNAEGGLICTTRLNGVRPWDIIADKDGGILVGDSEACRVHRFTFGQ